VKLGEIVELGFFGIGDFSVKLGFDLVIEDGREEL
jgi:hypothetical protein